MSKGGVVQFRDDASETHHWPARWRRRDRSNKIRDCSLIASPAATKSERVGAKNRIRKNQTSGTLRRRAHRTPLAMQLQSDTPQAQPRTPATRHDRVEEVTPADARERACEYSESSASTVMAWGSRQAFACNARTATPTVSRFGAKTHTQRHKHRRKEKRETEKGANQQLRWEQPAIRYTLQMRQEAKSVREDANKQPQQHGR